MAAWCVVAFVLATPASVSVSLEPPVIPFHRQAKLAISVEAPSGTEVELPDIAGLIGGLTLVGPLSAPQTEALKDGGRHITTTYFLDAIWIGEYPIQPITVEVGDKQVTVPGPVLCVRDLTSEELEAATQFVPNAGPMDPERALLKTWWFWVLCAATVGLLLAGTGVYWLRRKRSAAPAPPRPPWEVAYERLRALDEQQLPEQGEFEAYYVELSWILRQYIEDRFQIRAPEETTPEFLAEAARGGQFSENHQKLLAAFLRHADLVKFAQYEPGLADMERNMAETLRFIDETVPAPEALQEAAA